LVFSPMLLTLYRSPVNILDQLPTQPYGVVLPRVNTDHVLQLLNDWGGLSVSQPQGFFATGECRGVILVVITEHNPFVVPTDGKIRIDLDCAIKRIVGLFHQV